MVEEILIQMIANGYILDPIELNYVAECIKIAKIPISGAGTRFF